MPRTQSGGWISQTRQRMTCDERSGCCPPARQVSDPHPSARRACGEGGSTSGDRDSSVVAQHHRDAIGTSLAYQSGNGVKMKEQNNPAYREWVAAGLASGALLQTPHVPVPERKVDQQAASAATREWGALVKRVNREAKNRSMV